MGTGSAKQEAVWVRPDGRSVQYYQLEEPLSDKPPLAVVTGADTYVGRALAQALRGAGQRVAALAPVPIAVLAPSFLGSAGFAPAWEAILAACDVAVIYHCTRQPSPEAGVVPTRQQAAAAWETHVADTLEMLRRWASSEAPPPVVMLSSAAVYGPDAPRPVSEEAAIRPRSAWADSLAAAEALVRQLAPRHAILRLFEVVGPDGQGRVADGPTCPWARLARGRAVPVPAVADYLALDGVVDTLVRAGRHLAGGGDACVLNVGSGAAAAGSDVAAAFGLSAPPLVADTGLVADMARMQALWGWTPPAPRLGALARASQAALAAEALHD